MSDLTRQRARELRGEMTFPEQRLWNFLRGKRLAGMRFVKQSTIGPYIADFVCRDQRLIIEVDGNSHADRGQHDARRTRWLQEEGYQLVRVSNDDVLTNLEGVLAAIVAAAGIDVERWSAGEFGQMPEI